MESIEYAEGFVAGAVMAYKDSAEFVTGLANRLPPGLEFLRPQFIQLAESFKNKADNAVFLAENGGEA